MKEFEHCCGTTCNKALAQAQFNEIEAENAKLKLRCAELEEVLASINVKSVSIVTPPEILDVSVLANYALKVINKLKEVANNTE